MGMTSNMLPLLQASVIRRSILHGAVVVADDIVVLLLLWAFNMGVLLAECALVALGGKDIMVTKMLIEDVSAPLCMIKDC